LDGGLPLSLQLVGHALAEPLLVQAGAAFEGATEWHELHPPGWD
jgi:Asp-tRNA(Asn)/Glu-tRNA(Gln) amidotransferase A subunit family amidase